MEPLLKFLRQPWLITSRRLVLLMFVFVELGILAESVYSWECNLYGIWYASPWLFGVSEGGCWLVGCVTTVLLLYWGWIEWRRYRATKSAKAGEAGSEVQKEQPLPDSGNVKVRCSWLRRWWDVWVLLLVLLVCRPLEYWFDYLSGNRSLLVVSCSSVHGDSNSARAEWLSASARAEGVLASTPKEQGAHLHSFNLPEGDFKVCCDASRTYFALSHVRSTRRFTLRPHFDIPGEIDLYMCPLNTEQERKRVQSLLDYYEENPQAPRPRIRHMPFTLCQDAAVLYLDYGEYAFLPVPKGTESSDVPALIYFSLQPNDEESRR